MRQFFRKKLFFLLTFLLLASGLLLPLHPAQAAEGILSGIFTLGNVMVEKVALAFSVFFLQLLGTAIGWMANGLDAFLKYQTNNAVYHVFVVEQSWTIIRNFVNLFFILVLITMAFGTIFNISRYTYREMLAPFLIAALLVNFSLAIGGYIIAFSNDLSGVFLKSIGSLSDRFGQGTAIAKIATGGEAQKTAETLLKNAGGGVLDVTIGAVFAVLFLAITFVAFAAVFLFTIARLFVLWFLLIISPIAWVGYSFPNLRKNTWGNWWENFLCWCFFLPYYLFFMMFAVSFVAFKNNGGQGFPPLHGITTLAGLSFYDFMFYSLSIIFMVAGLGIAKKWACASSTGVGKVFGSVENYVKSTTGYAGAQRGLIAKGKQIMEEGALGIPGQRAGRIREAKIAEKFSFGALRREQEKQLVKEASDVKEKLKDRTEGDLLAMKDQGPLTQQLAARELLREKGALSAPELIKTYDLYRKRNANQAATKFISGVDFKDLSGEERKSIAGHLKQTAPEDLESRRKLVKVMAEKGDFRKDEAGLENAARLFNLEGDQIDIINKARKYGMVMASKIEARLGLVRDEANRVIGDVEAATAKALERSIERAKIDDMLELSTGALTELQTNEKFIKKFREIKFRENFLSRASEGQVNAIQPMLNTIQAGQLDEDIPKLEQELANKAALRQQTQQNQQALRTQVIDLQTRLAETEQALNQAADAAERQRLSRQLAELRFDSEQLTERAKELSRRLSQADEDIQKTQQSVDQLRAERARLT